MTTKVSPSLESIHGRKNLLINGGFDIFQRAPTITVGA